MNIMKRYNLYILFAAAAIFAAACTEEAISEKDDLASRTDKSEKLEVSFSLDGSPVSALNFTHNATVRELEVNVNNENLYWNLESNRSWCKVVEAEHKGSGTVTLEISANEGFDAREQATLTFVAGAYRGSSITADQTATAFILNQPYFVSPIGGGALTVKVTTLDETVWSYEENDWIGITEGGKTSTGGFTTTTLTLTPAVNTDDSRFGSVELASGAEKDYIYVYQFGTDLNYDDAGNIFFASGTPASLSLTAPAFMVKNVQVPDFATGTIAEGEGTATITIVMEDNLSDCAEVRQMDASLQLGNASATLVALPAIVQDYTPAYGLVTAAGLQAFAKAVKEGTSTADWESEGVVRVLRDIDMNGVSGWEGIGTADHPFTGKFNGGGFSVINLKNTAYGLFGHAKDATIENICLGKGCSIYNGLHYTGPGCFGGIVSVAEGTTVSGCGMAGTIEFGGSSDDEDPLYVGGIVGKADNSSTVKGCSLTGSLTLSSPASDGTEYYCGGIAGLCEGALTASEVLGKLTYSSGVATAYIGGVQSKVAEGASVGNNSFMGTVSLGGSAMSAAAGGLYGLLEAGSFDAATDKSVSLGTVEIKAFRANAASCIHVGGFAGKAAAGTSPSFKGYESQTNILMDCSAAVYSGKYVFIGGFLGGCDPDNPVESATFDNLKNSGAIAVKVNTSIACNVRRTWIGGVAGMVNGPSSFTSCVNNADLGKSSDGVYCARSNGYNQIIGGIAGHVHGGNAVFANCTNQADLESHIYNNNGLGNGTWDGMYTLPSVGGILGAFNYYTSPETYTLSMTSCANGKRLFSYRGHTGGIVGYCCNATIDGCTNLGRQSNGTNDQCAIRGGIAGGAANATVKNCTATGDITSKTYGSADHANAGGIVGMVSGSAAVTVDNCSYFGAVKAEKGTGDKPFNAGGIVGMGTSETHVTGCKYGGSVQGVEINENNVGTLKNVIGNESGEATGTNYWSGNI